MREQPPVITFDYVPGGPFSALCADRYLTGRGTTAELVCERLPDYSILRVTKIPTSLFPHRLEDNRAVMLREIKVYKRLDAHPHPFVLQSLGADPANYALYLPHCKYGNLSRCLQVYKHLLTPERKLRWCYQLASAVRHLHSLQIYHCDLSIGNVLVDSDTNIKLCDFGGSSLDYSPPERLARGRLTIRDYSDKTEWTVEDLNQIDIFALASLFYLIDTGVTQLYKHIPDQKEVLALYSKVIFPDTSGIPFGDLIRDVWTEKTNNIDEILLRIISRFPLPMQ